MNTIVHTAGEVIFHPKFRLTRRQYISSLSIEFMEFLHIETGARHYHLAADNNENVFLVMFKTHPMDSKGAAHILEHTVLNGSKKYSIGSPFQEMLSRSLKTYMNAFTSSDYTAYPFATQNKADFYNLLSVYLDATFFPNLDPLDFAQEGIRVEIENKKLAFKGVVFNEMKGVLSAPYNQLYYAVTKHLFPTTTYGYNSGGNPADIVGLTYDELLHFYQSNYHPSNALFMTFGNLDPLELQTAIEEQALKYFSQGNKILPETEQRWTNPKQVITKYSVDSEDLSQKTYIQLTWLLTPNPDMKTRMVLRLIAGVLLEHSASPLRHYLETCDLGQSISPLSGLDNGHEMVFFCGIQGSNAEHAKALELGVLAVLNKLVNQAIDPAYVEGILHQMELSQREIGGGTQPYGLNILSKGLNLAANDEDILNAWLIEPYLSEIRVHLQDPLWLPKQIQYYLIDNPHRLLLTFKPDASKTERDQQAEQDYLEYIDQILDEKGRQKLVAQSEALVQRQAQIYDLSGLPKVGLEDIPADLHIVEGEITTLPIYNQPPFYRYTAGTNGLFYHQVLIALPDSLLNSPLMNVYISLMGRVGAGTSDYLSIQSEQVSVSGGINLNISLKAGLCNRLQNSAYLVLSTKALVSKKRAIELMKFTFERTRFDEKARIIEILHQINSHTLSNLSEVGHSYALQTASRAMSSYATHQYNAGLPRLCWMSDQLDLIKMNPLYLDKLLEEIQSLHQHILGLPRQYLLVAEQDEISNLSSHIAEIWEDSHGVGQIKELKKTSQPSPESGDIAWLIQSNVQFCALSYPAVVANHQDSAALMVLGPYLQIGFLHRAIREQGGAYGCGANYDSDTCSFNFYSFRDPRITKTFADFEASIKWLLSHDQDKSNLDEAILSLIANIDKPSSPAIAAISAGHALLHGRSPTFRRSFRSALLSVTLEDIKRVAAQYLKKEKAVRGIVAPYSKAAELEGLGFVIKRMQE